MPEIERDGEELPRMSPGVGCDSTAQGNKVICSCCLVYWMNSDFELMNSIADRGCAGD